MKTQKKYEAPQTQHAEVELEQGFMKASVFEGGTENAEGLTIEQHGFAKPFEDDGTTPNKWEGSYDSWDN
jgi:hypothetical protein